MLRKAGFTLMIALSALVLTNRPASAGPTPVLDAHVSSGADPDFTAIARLHVGGLLVFDDIKLALDAHLSFSGFLRVNDEKGVEARSAGINLGGRYAFRNEKFHGPYVALGFGWGKLSGKPRERKVEDMETCASAISKDTCTFDIKQQLNSRLGFGWGFGSGKKTTVGVRLDVTYFAFNVAPGEDQPRGAPNPNLIPRLQDTWAVMIGLEFMRWK